MSVPLEHDYIGLSMEKAYNISPKSEIKTNTLFNLKATELTLGLPGFDQDLGQTQSPMKKRGFCDVSGKWGFNGDESSNCSVLFGVNGGLETKQTQAPALEDKKKATTPAASRAQVVGWPPIRSFRKNTMATNLSKNEDNSGSGGCLYVKVSMDGAPYLRKVDLKTYDNYAHLSKALEKMFGCFTLGQCTSNGLKEKEGLSESNLKDILDGDECVVTYEDKDGDWMLVGDVPWEMFVDSCKRLRIMKGSEAIGLAPRSMEKGKNQIRSA